MIANCQRCGISDMEVPLALDDSDRLVCKECAFVESYTPDLDQILDTALYNEVRRRYEDG